MTESSDHHPLSERARLPLLGACLFVVAGSFIYHVWTFYFFTDDCFIIFRYADNLHRGLGLVWNPGERVEGYTSLLWVLVTWIGLVIGAAPEWFIPLVSILCGLGVLALLVSLWIRAVRWPVGWLIVLILVLCSSRSFTAWCTGGLETMCFTFLVFAGVVRYLTARDRHRECDVFSGTLFGLSAITRPEGVLFAGLVWLFFLVDVAARRRSLKALCCFSIPIGIFVFGQLGFRIYYYDAWLPNTFYAKVAGVWWEQGFQYARLFFADYRLQWFLPLVLVTLIVRPTQQSFLFFVLIAVYVVYVLSVGGDRFEFRFLVVIFPYLYWLIVSALVWLWEREKPVVRGLAGVLGILLVVSTLVGSHRPEARRERFGVQSISGANNYAKRRAEEGKFLRTLIDEGTLSPETVLCVGGAGAIPYYTRLETIDRRGLNDRYIARLPIDERGIIAHEHDAPLDYMQKRGVAMFDILNQIVHKRFKPKFVGKKLPFQHPSQRLPLVTLKAHDRFLVFATMPEVDVAKEFPNFEIVTR